VQHVVRLSRVRRLLVVIRDVTTSGGDVIDPGPGALRPAGRPTVGTAVDVEPGRSAAGSYE